MFRMASHCTFCTIPLYSIGTDSSSSVSPSVYIAFSALSAYDYCGQVGAAFTNTTIAFHPDELSTVVDVPTATDYNVFSTTATNGQVSYSTATDIYYTTTTPAALNYADLGQNCSTISGYSFVPGNPSAALASSRKYHSFPFLTSFFDFHSEKS